MIDPIYGKTILVVFDKSASTIGDFFPFRLSYNLSSHCSRGDLSGENQSVATYQPANRLRIPRLIGNMQRKSIHLI